MLRLIINESTYFSNFCLDKIYCVNRFDRNISYVKGFIASSNRISAESFTLFQLFSTILFTVNLFYSGLNLFGHILGSSILAFGLMFYYLEKDNYYIKNYYLRTASGFPFISMLFFLFLTVLPIFLLLIQVDL